jgi:hypothetical protein
VQTASCSVLYPSSFCRLQSAPAAMSISVAATSPRCTARWSGVSRRGPPRRRSPPPSGSPQAGGPAGVRPARCASRCGPQPPRCGAPGCARTSPANQPSKPTNLPPPSRNGGAIRETTPPAGPPRLDGRAATCSGYAAGLRTGWQRRNMVLDVVGHLDRCGGAGCG